MSKVLNKNLKWGIYKSPQSGDAEIERYIIENKNDLKIFNDNFPQINTFGMYNNIEQSINEGYVIILTDPHKLTGMPTYCFESKPDNTHPSSMHRVK